MVPCSFRAVYRHSWDTMYHPVIKDVRGELWMVTVIHVVILIRWNYTVKWIPSQKLEASFLFQKIQNQEQSCCLMKCKMNQHVFLSTLRLQLSRFHLGKILLTSDPDYQVPKSIFPCSLELCKDTPGPHCIIPWEKMSGESVLWVLTTIQQEVTGTQILSENP